MLFPQFKTENLNRIKIIKNNSKIFEKAQQRACFLIILLLKCIISSNNFVRKKCSNPQALGTIINSLRPSALD